MEVAPEVFAEHHVFVLLGYLMAKLFDCFDLGLIETHCLVRLTRELPLHGQYQGLTGKILNLAHLPLREPSHLLGQTQHTKAHMARLIRQDTFTDLADQGVLAVLGHHAKNGDGQGLGHELGANGFQIPLWNLEDAVEQPAEVGCQRIDHPHFVVHVAGQDLRVTGFVHHLSSHEELGIETRHDVDQLATDHHGKFFAIHELAQPPG